jgi:hypothetical protein
LWIVIAVTGVASRAIGSVDGGSIDARCVWRQRTRSQRSRRTWGERGCGEWAGRGYLCVSKGGAAGRAYAGGRSAWKVGNRVVEGNVGHNVSKDRGLC